MRSKRNLPAVAFRVLAVLAAFIVGPLLTVQAAAVVQPTITQIGLNPGKEVQLMIYNLPADTDFTVTMSEVGNQGYGPVVAHFNSDTGGTRSYWFEILTDVASAENAVVRIDSGTGIAAYATFQNTTAETSSSTASSASATSPTSGAIRVLHVQKGGVVTAELKNLPLDTQFTVTIGTAGSQGFDGYKVGDLSTGELSDHIGTFEIPVDLMTEAGLDLRIEAPGYLYLVTFSNTSF